MGYWLYRMIRDGAPAAWTPPMIQVAQAIADDARDPRPGEWEEYTAGGPLPWSSRPVEGHWTRLGEWRDGLAQWTGLSVRTIRRALADLTAAGYEMRQVIGKDRHGQPVYAHKGQAVRFQVPYLPPRQPPKAARSGDLSPSKAARSGDLSPSKAARSGDLSPSKAAKSGAPFPHKDLNPPPKENPPVRGETPPYPPVEDQDLPKLASSLRGAVARNPGPGTRAGAPPQLPATEGGPARHAC